MNIVDRSADLKTIEEGVKNKFRWTWLEEKDCLGDFLSDYVRKTDQAGIAFCIICNDTLKYRSGGKRDLKAHASTSKHQKHRDIKKTNQTLPSIFSAAKAAVEGLSSGGNGVGDGPSTSTGSIMMIDQSKTGTVVPLFRGHPLS